LFFKLFRCKDKPLRQMLYSHIVTDIKNINEKHKNQKMNRTLQNFMYTMLNDPSDIAAKKSLDVMIDLYRKRIWFAFPSSASLFKRLQSVGPSPIIDRNDAKTVNVISQGCFSKFSKVKVDAIQFFLSAESTEIEEEDVLHHSTVPLASCVMYARSLGDGSTTNAHSTCPRCKTW
jgi:protein SDA1